MYGLSLKEWCEAGLTAVLVAHLIFLVVLAGVLLNAS